MSRRVVLLALSLVACERELSGPGLTRPDAGPPAAPVEDGGVAPSPSPSDPEAATSYAALCASCHGDRGEGRAPNPALDRWTRGRDALASAIDARMPLGRPELCDARCAERLADYILASLQRPPTPPPACDVARRPARQLRLLTRREWAASVEAVIGDCREHRFELEAPQGAREVVVAGSFNGWAATAAAGGWPMSREGSRFVLTRALPDGHHEYKLVIDGTSWIADPSNPRTAPDGFGGQNSALDVSCAAEPDVYALTANFPAETRPPGFPFDDHAGAAAMNVVRLDEEWGAAERLAAAVAPRVASAAGCDRDRAACAERLLDTVVRRAFRRPLEAEERARYRAHALSEGGVAQLLRATFASPSFLYRSELGALDAASGRFRLTGFELASALSFGLWGAPPDDALLDAAARGALDDRAGVEAEARRLLADPRARPALERFAVAWLGVERVLTADKRTEERPDYDLPLRASLLAETGRLFSHVVLEGSHGLAELFTADYTFADGALARFYGVGVPAGPGLSQVSLAGTPRRGVLGHGSVLGAYAYSDQSSPVRRGVFVRERLLCQHLGTPPPNAGGIPEVDPTATTRERFAQHSANPTCAGCHTLIDPIGFGFERFDALGAVRSQEAGRDIDDRGVLSDVEAIGDGSRAEFTGVAELGALLARSPAVEACVARQYYRFARGALEGEGDRCAIEALAARLHETRDLRELIVATYASPAFLERE